MPTRVNARFADDLRQSGVSFAATHIGTAVITSSVNSMSREIRDMIAPECILHISGLASLAPPHEINPAVASYIGEIVQETKKIEINITSKMIKVIYQNRLLHRLPLHLFSVAAKGEKGTRMENMIGFIAKNKQETDRRCFVVDTSEINRIWDTLNAAIYVARLDESPKEQPTTSNDGFAVPELPSRFRNSVTSSSTENLDPDVARDVKNQHWYHGILSRVDAQALLKNPGDFLVRQSDHSPGQYILSGLTSENEPKHLILLDDHKKVRTRDREFATITHLIDYHTLNGIAVVVSVSKERPSESALNLINPIPRA
ncbi:unnamed protein product [Caenorhabditis bovis]|uniref:SH2 domain-containing protein n=1 Tax=Caenorhabditis bovis TaxID=2654633 RepID=A0A8S1F8R1_9PELO|nr:unnamed protein product [Caenorhabditis bovis]